MTPPVGKLPSLPPGRGPARPDRPAGSSRLKSPVRHISSQELLGGGHALVIHHLGQEYHLRLTRNDKLILTK